jgi:hypothetical protein
MSTDVINTTSNTDFSLYDPQLLSTLSQHQLLWEANGGDDFRQEKRKNKLEIHTDAVSRHFVILSP